MLCVLITENRLIDLTVDVLTWIAVMYFIRNNNSILFPQIKNRVMVYLGTLIKCPVMAKTL